MMSLLVVFFLYIVMNCLFSMLYVYFYRFFPSHKCSAIITKSFKKMVDSKAFSWKKVSKSTKNTYFDDFKV